jgi:hypothetical protein
VRTDRVLVSQPVFPPAFRHDLRFLECIEQSPVEKLRPHCPIERSDIAVFPWRARLDVERLQVQFAYHVTDPPAMPCVGGHCGPHRAVFAPIQQAPPSAAVARGFAEHISQFRPLTIKRHNLPGRINYSW